jgi:hypothetical protein
MCDTKSHCYGELLGKRLKDIGRGEEQNCHRQERGCCTFKYISTNISQRFRCSPILIAATSYHETVANMSTLVDREPERKNNVDNRNRINGDAAA